MRVFTRRLGDKLVIGDNVIIEIVHETGKKSKLAISAPKDVMIRCGEELSPEEMKEVFARTTVGHGTENVQAVR